jgi:hypothetical protein
MSRCDRFETEGVLLLERGQPLEEHFSSCPDCLAARIAHERLREGLAGLGEGEQPPAGWQARVWQRIEQRRERRRWRSWWIALPAGLAASLAAFLLLRTPAPPPAFLQAKIEAGSVVYRGGEAKAGDFLRLTASTGGARHAELRVYRNDAELVLSCSTESPCSRNGTELKATLLLEGPGRYQPLLLLSEKPIPKGSAGLDADTGAALAAGADVRLGPETAVH